MSASVGLFWDDFPIFFQVRPGPTHPPTSKVNSDFWNWFNFSKPLSLKMRISLCCFRNGLPRGQEGTAHTVSGEYRWLQCSHDHLTGSQEVLL